MTTEDELRAVIHKLETQIEDERRRIVNDIHDSLNTDLLAARMYAQKISHTLKTQEKPDLDELEESCQVIVALTMDVYKKFKDISMGMRPQVLEVLGLEYAVEEMVTNLNKLHPTCRFFYLCRAEVASIPHDISIAIYRAVQEAFSNIIKHANAKKVDVNILEYTESNLLEISIADDGDGFDPSNANVGIGLVGMRVRVEALKGRLTIESEIGVGTTIKMQFQRADITHAAELS